MIGTDMFDMNFSSAQQEYIKKAESGQIKGVTVNWVPIDYPIFSFSDDDARREFENLFSPQQVRIGEYEQSDKYARVIETDHLLLVNGISIPYPAKKAVEVSEDGGVFEVTVRFYTDSYVRLKGAASDEFERGYT